MSTLIIGVLFVVALVAIIALVFVLRSEPRSTGTVPANPAASATPDVAPTNQPDTVTKTNESTPSIATAPTAPSVPTSTEESHFAMANGQFHELAVELHTLHEQSQEIEHRLSVLSEMIERIERSQDAHITEEYSSLVDRQAAN